LSIYFYLLSSLFAIFVLYPLISFYPYYFTYTSPLFINSNNANRIIGHKPFGVGIPELKDLIFEKYGEYPNIGFVDTKPMRSIYMNSKIFDIRESGTRRYDILVLAINEDMPENVINGQDNFEYASSLYINGLEYWRIYVKK
ncbi:MAG: hypothetical protein KC414_14145, partial [Romboutsia sp.]|nr:hypothetical protein [Romboutsia sp.]